ncbi:MAG: succinate dehydrogenase iron-sulfur subunit [Candidatus Bathyarchaeota archaeon]|nr:succinate dehydrogenase iron-sulfur subunit [Candidatus Bathyarchaeota archaeon]
MNGEVVKVVEFQIRRYDPEAKKYYTSTYKVPVLRGTTILDALNYVKENLDETLTFRHSCRMGICGSCAVNVNGKPMLACYTQVLDLNTDTVTIEPLSNLPVIKDLVVDIQPFFKNFRKIKNVLVKTSEAFKRPEEFTQSPEALKRYWDLTLCTKCSICHSACPAAIDEKFLGPSALTANYRFIIDSRDEGLSERLKAMADNVWLCTSCNSCTLFCPKLVNCANSVVEDRSLLVEMGAIPRTVKDVLESVMKYHNPMGTHQSKRMAWAEGLNVKAYPKVAKADVLYFVCCSAAYDVRNRELARAMAAMLDRFGVDYATLGEEEWCCGDHILRMGEKGLFEMLAEHNMAVFQKFNADRILTVSPHCYNTFKNEKLYKDLGLNVQHYTQFLAEAIDKGKLKPSKPYPKRVAYHDPCFLGKRNQIYEEPRRILQSIRGLEFIEMKRVREAGFCCGGGAGRVWTEEAEPEKRPCVNRVKEALELGVDVIAVACPFCVTTLEDAVKVLEVEDKIAVRDVLEILMEVL